jgi:hypothetical protein
MGAKGGKPKRKHGSIVFVAAIFIAAFFFSAQRDLDNGKVPASFILRLHSLLGPSITHCAGVTPEMFDTILGILIFYKYSYILFRILTFFRRETMPHYFFKCNSFTHPAQFNRFVNTSPWRSRVFFNTFCYIRGLHAIFQNCLMF